LESQAAHATTYPQLRAGRSLLQRKCTCGGGSAGLSGECEECASGKLSRKSRSPGQSVSPDVPPIVHEVLRSPGQPLDPAVRAFMEPGFAQGLSRVPAGAQSKLTVGTPGDAFEREADDAAERAISGHRPRSNTQHDFSRVRLHTDAQAAESARAVNALAYTVGSDIVFASGQYAPSTASGRRLLAHELAHVVQQSAGASPIVQRQIPIPVFDEFDPCVVVGGQKLCGSYAKTACEKVPSLPGCSAICKKLGCKKPEKPSVSCPPGFRPGRTSDFKGQCCIEHKEKKPGLTQEEEDLTVESAANCCPPERAASTPLGLRCCPPGETASGGECVKGSQPQPPGPGPDPGPVLPSCLPDEKPNLYGGCCKPGDKVDKKGFPCLDIQPPKPQPPPVTPPPGDVVLNFEKDMPAAGAAETEATLLNSLTSASKSAWPGLVKQLQDNPTWKLQLVGRASPEGTPAYNLDLSTRRAQLVEKVLVAKGVDRGRIVDVAPVCTGVESGVYSCGETGSKGPADRQVKVVFEAGAAATP
jgi:hypothetical protein